jgi:5-methylcytosine-specific restriction enzyme A
MPYAALRPCPTPGCLALTQGGHCPAHTKPGWSRTKPAPPRIRGRKLQRLRARLFTNQPLCVLCLAIGRTTMATIRDHTIPLAEGGRDDETNEQPLCQMCSDAKTAEESRRGRMRLSV